ncbi:hypothetical protein [Amycolatopsis sp. DSM 110486]|uniref:hypothetical protein n=1 Tax=Amycolatopsis sp. DSM 110486 TaxID=2865832 RepID=UPI001C69F0B7|nr:hypothetical protein [Amycolatopsis sp. DSM 110486]QYN24616.1 hypothetical protein K1T34_20570 [Amycolatopsis sp. DSM 110486]
MTAACPYLGPQEIAKAIEDPNIYDSRELSPKPTGYGFTAYACEYNRADDPGSHLADLAVLPLPTKLPQEKALETATELCADKPQSLTEAAVYCLSKDNGTAITVAVPSHSVTRIAMFSLAAPVNDSYRDGYVTLAKTLADRL